MKTAEQIRLQQSDLREKHWKRWGPYLSERAWGTVREDYSDDGEPWNYFPHDHARSRAYRWNEDGIAGISDRHQVLCFAVALWNEKDPILKERLFGLSGPEGNHGEDVKEYYFYLDNTPTHSYMKYLYKYPQCEYPYAQIVETNRGRSKQEREFELIDTGIFDNNRYFDVFVEYAKADVEDILVRITVANRGDQPAPVRVIPTLWFRNTWSWDAKAQRPVMSLNQRDRSIVADANESGTYTLTFDGDPEVLFTDNETNLERLYGTQNQTPYVKDAFHRYVVNGETGAVNPAGMGTKAGLHYSLVVPAQGKIEIRLRLTKSLGGRRLEAVEEEFDRILAERAAEANQFYDEVLPPGMSDDDRRIMRQAFAGLLWSKQFYHFVVKQWLDGDPAFPTPSPTRRTGRNHEWQLLYNADVISMPDKWEYPWYAAWDLAFHCVSFAYIDPEFAKEQLTLMLREWYMHPNGQIPAYEWSFGDVNPPVHAWAALQVYRIEKRKTGIGDTAFLERIFHKLMLNFTWWVNRKDFEGQNVFQGGFLGLDNIGVFDRSSQLPTGGHLEQSDGTSWMAMYSLDLLAIAMELAKEDPTYEDVASKFWEHFMYIARAMNHLGDDGISLWDEEDGFYYDVLHVGDQLMPLRVRSMVGLIPLYAVQTLEPELLDRMPAFARRLKWFIENRPDLTENMACMRSPGHGERRLFSIAGREQLERILRVMLDQTEFLSEYGVRAVSRRHREQPYCLTVNGVEHRVSYEPAESATGLFGGNSNWRGPIWMPVNFLLVEALRRFHAYYNDSVQVECPVGSGRLLNLEQVADEISSRLLNIFRATATGRRPVFGSHPLQDDPHWRDYIPFHEYFHGDTGEGIGASHQTGWTALVTALMFEQWSNKTEEIEIAANAASGD